MYMYPDYYEFFGQGIDGALGGMIGGAVGLLAVIAVLGLAIGILSLACSVAMYVFHSLGLYTIAQRRGIHRPWLSWVPVANLWILGSISDQYQYVAKGKTCSRRKLLLALGIVNCVAVIVVNVCSFVLGFSLAIEEGALNAPAITSLSVMGIVSLLMCVVSILAMVFQFIAYYDLFQSCNPGNATVFLVLSILFNFLLPIFVFCCRKKDLGMPPRRSQAAEPVYQPAPVYQPEVVTPEATSPEVVEAQEEDFEA